MSPFHFRSAIIFDVNNLQRLWTLAQLLIMFGLIALLGVSSDWNVFNRELNKAHRAVELNDSRAASQSFAQAAELSPQRVDLWEEAGIYAQLAGENQLAKSYFDRIENESGLSTRALIALGDIAAYEGDMQSAIQYWESSLTAEDSYDLRYRLAEAYYQSGDLKNAVLHQTSLVEFNPTDSSANLHLGLMLAALDPEASLAYLSHAIDLNPDLAPRINPLIRSIRSSQRSDDPSYPFVSAGQLLASIEEWSLAKVALSKAAELNPEYAEAWAYLGEARQQVGEDGFADLEKALLIDPDSVAANALMGLYWQRQERYDLALVYLHAAARLDALNPAWQAEIGNTLGLMGNLSSAESHYLRAVDLASKDPTYWQILANFYIKYESNLRDKGLAAARQAVILDPENPASLDALAQMYLLLEYPHIARRFLERALAADGSYPPAHLHMGLVHLINGDPLLAFQKFSLAKELSPPGSPTADLAERLLDIHFP